MITLGITGRSGCGKSTVTAVFAAHGVPLVDADQISREILLPVLRCCQCWPSGSGQISCMPTAA